MTITKASSLLLLLSLSSCSLFNGRQLEKLPLTNGPNSLDTVQAMAVFERAQYYPNGTQLSLCMITGDSENYVGIERRNDSLVYVENRDSIFEIGSITKTFTGTMLAKLVLDGTLSLNDPIAKFLPIALHQSLLNGKEPTLVELADHTSGLPFEPTNVRNDEKYPFDQYAPYRSYTKDRLYDYLEHQLVLQSTPGEQRLYSNLGAGLLGHILTLVSGKSYEQLLFETVCAPLDMRDTFVEPASGRMRRMIRGRYPTGDPLPFSSGDCGVLTGCGGIKSTARDLVKYLKMNMTDTTYFYLAQKPTKQFDEHFSGALGWAPYSERGKVHQGAFGATPGYTCGVIFERKMHVGVVVLSNVSPYLGEKKGEVEGLCRALYDPLTNGK
ncbi:MAG TPA: serine hydrolase domain-containing protein [Bacteroidota bacterium]|nr:serine hydrolase domain-containing protein [Bacteroidota bacterium]